MYTRLLTILAVSAFVLTLLFAVAAGAQDETTDTAATLGDGGGIQVQQVQQQQVGPAAAPAPYGGPLAGEKVTVRDRDNNGTIDKGDILEIEGDYKAESGASITIEDEDGTQGTFVDGRNAEITNTEDGIEIRITGNPLITKGNRGADTTLDESNNVRAVNSTGVQREGSGGSGNGGNNDGGTGDGTSDDTSDTTGVTPAQTDDTTGTTTGTGTTDPAATDPATADPATADPAAEDAGDSANREGSFRCESFLHVVRDDDGALRAQYRDGRGDDELIVQRFEQCLEADVLANTIPDKTLPFTGGPSLPIGGGVLLLVTGAALALRMMRR